MRPISFGRRAVVVAAGVLFAACSDGGGPSPDSRVQSLEVTSSSAILFVGTSGLASARALDSAGEEVTDAAVRWRSSAPAILEVSETGVLTGRGVGTANAIAQVGNVTGSVAITVELLPVVAISITPSVTTLPRGATVQLAARLTDQLGGEITGRTIAWTSTAVGVASVSAAGLVTGVSAGTATVTATVDGRSASAEITVTVAVTPTGPHILSVAPALLVPGGSVTITGTDFAATLAGNEVRVAGVLATVTTATATQITATLPVSGFGCAPTREVYVQVVRGTDADARLHPLQAVTPRTLAVGESLFLTGAGAPTCLELVPTGGRYVVSVFNVATTSTTTASFRLRGRAGLAVAGDPAPVVSAPRALEVPAVPLVAPSRSGLTVNAALRTGELDAHARLLDANREALRRGGSLATAGARVAQRAGAIAGQAAVGSIVPMKIPNVGGFLDGGADFCVSNFAINARVVYNGTRAIVLEDTATVFGGSPTLVGQSDSLYRAIGEEFDATMFGILETNFGSPLRMDDQLDGNGKIIMLFSPRINSFQRLSGFVVSCDFFPTTTYPSSNRAEVFYSVVPSTAGTTYTPGTRPYWYWTVRSTIVHEAKHIAAYANRIRDFGGSANLEDAWLEEGTARHAEELWARRVAYDDLAAGRNATYQESLFCDVRPQGQQGGAACIGKPYGMYRHFGTSGLYDYLLDPGTKSPLGPILGSDFTYYASAWSLVRWAIDNHATPEASFLTALVRTSAKGVANLTARVGRSWEDIVGEWSLALYLDDRAGFVSQNPRLRMPSWNMPSIYQGMATDLPSSYPRSYPLIPRAAAFGDFEITVANIGGGSFALIELSGAQAGRQLLELRGATVDTPASNLRVALVRVE